MKFNRILALSAAFAAVATSSAHAAVTFTDGDLLMGFHATGGQGVGQTYVVDLGNVSNFTSATGTVTLSLGNITADLAAIYGANWSTRTDLSWGIAGTPSNAVAVGDDPRSTIYASRAGSDAVAWQLNTSARNNTSTIMEGAQTAFATYSATANSPFAVIEGDGDPNSWRSYMAPGGTAGNTLGGNDFGAFGNIEGDPTQVLSLFRMSGNAAGTDLGTFAIGTNGVTFTAVPEASSAVIAGLAGSLLAFRRRRNA